MKKSAIFRKLTALLIVLVMVLLTSCSAETGTTEELTTGDDVPEVFNLYTETAQSVKKTESVYVTLDADGSVKNVTVSDWLHADRSGIYIDDTTTLEAIHATRGNYSSFENGRLTWHTDSSDVYYEGKSTQPLPVDISIRYYLDGAEIAPADLAGKSGKVRMDISVKNNVSYDVEMNGKKMKMYAPLVTVGGMMLPYDNFSEIEVTNGMAVGAGSYEVVMLTSVPGISESLNLSSIDISALSGVNFSETFSISATVTDFTLADTYFAIMPLASVNADLSMPETLDDVKSILTELKDMQAVIERIDPKNVLVDFMTDTAKVKAMLNIVQKGLNVYNENEKMLDTMTEILTPENIETLTNFVSSLDAEEMQSLMGVMSNVPGLQSMLGSLLDMSEGLEEIKPILDKFSAALEDPEIAASMERLPETVATMTELMTFLNENKELLDVMTKLLNSNDVKELEDVVNQLENSDIDLGSLGLETSVDAEDIIARMNVWLQLNYRMYTSAPDYMETSCMFICKTQPIK